MGALFGKDNIKLYDTVNWTETSDRFAATNFKYSEYYRRRDFHGIKGGYLNAIASIGYILYGFANRLDKGERHQKLLN